MKYISWINISTIGKLIMNIGFLDKSYNPVWGIVSTSINDLAVIKIVF